MSKPAYRRVLVKVSGEALQGSRNFGIDPAFLTAIAKDIVATKALGAEIAVMVGGGNFIRGATTDTSIDRAAADQMGMLATIINAIAIGEAIDKASGSARVMSAVAVGGFCEPYSRQRGLKHLENGHVVVLGGGTGNPFFTTDTGAALRAAELRCNAMFKATNVDGVYDSDPDKNKNAKRFEKLTHDEALSRDLKVMDAAAFALARDAKLPIIVFSIREPGAIAAAFSGKARSTIVTP